MKRKPLNKSRFTYLKQNTPLNVVPEKKLKKADLAGLIENRGKSRFRTKKLRERVETLIRSDLVFKNKANANPLTLLRTTFVPQARNTLKAKYSFHLNMNAKRSVHLLVLGAKQVKQVGSTCQATHAWHSNAHAKQVQRSVHCFVRDTCATLHKRDRVFSKKSSLFAWNPHERPVLTRASQARKSSTGVAFVADKQHLVAKNRQASAVPRQEALPATHAWHSNARYAVVPTLSKAHQQKKTVEKDEIGTKYIVKRTVLDSTRTLFNTRFKVHSQDLKQLIEGRGRKVSPYKARLLERKKLSLIYGNLGWRELRKCVLQSKHKKGVASPKSGNKKTRPQTSSLPENLITLLESRLDVVLYRCRFFPSFSSCKQAINHGKILVNHRQVRIAGHLLKAGDLIQVNPQSKQSLLVQSGSTACFQSFKPEITLCQGKKGAIFSEHKQSLPTCLTCFARSTAIASKTFVACPGSARVATHKQEHVVCKKANYLLALENEKQKTLLYFQNKIKSRPFYPSLPSALLTRFDPLHHFPWNIKQKPNQLNNTSLGAKGHNKQDYGSCFLRPSCLGTAVPASDALSTTFKRTKTPLSLNLGNQANSLFRDLKERKRILRTLSSRFNERLDGDGESFKQKQHMMRSTDRLIKPLRNRDNPSLFLRPQSKSGVASQARKEHNTCSSTSSLARAATGLRGLMRAKHASKSEHLLRATCQAIKQSTGLKKLFPPFYRAVKPLNLEVSYQTLTAIFLFPPQKVYFPAHIDLEMIGKSI